MRDFFIYKLNVPLYGAAGIKKVRRLISLNRLFL